ncbi:MAG TPA: lipid A biosynthesis acyltransferase [Bacteroidia bacterium]
MSEWQGKSRGGVLGYKIFIWLLRSAGLKAAYVLLFFVAFYFIPFAPSATKSSWFYFRKIHRFGIFKSAFAVYKNYFSFGQSILDRIALLGGVKTHLSFEFDGEENLHQLAADKQPALLISAHIGNWEIAGNLFKNIGGQINILMYEAEHENLKKLLDSVQKEKSKTKNVNVITLKDDLSHVLELKKVIDNGELIALHGDRVPPQSKFFYFNFMGRQAKFPTGPFYLSGKFKVPVCFVFACKEGMGHYHLFCTKPIYYNFYGSPTQREESLKQLINDYVIAVEEKVKKYPYQWYNFYKFWE